MSEDGDEPDSGVVTLNCSDEVPTSSKIRSSGGILAGGQNQSLYLDQVLDNVLENVLLFLTNRRDRNSASLVCKSWYRAEALTRSEVFIGNCYAVSPRRTIKRFPNIRSVTLKGRPRFSDFNMMPINWGAFFSPWCTALASAYNGLQKIRLKRLTITDDDLDLLAHSFRLLEELVLVCSEGFGTSGLAIVAGKCKRLRVLDLIEDEVSDDEIDWLSCFPEGTTNLESLIFDCVDCATNAESIALLVSRSPNLKKLRLSRFVSIDQLYRLMIQAPKLTDLGTGSFSSPEIGMFPADQEPDYASAFSGCGSLVCLSGFREIAPNYLPAIYPSCPNLVSLNFSYANITTDQLKSVIFHCHKLRTFWVLDSVCDDGLKAVAEACKDLQEIRVFPMDAQEGEEGPVSEIGLQAISEGCRKLRSILYFCQRMTNAAVVSMSVNCSDLEVFRLCIMGRHQPDHLTQQPMDQGFGAIVMNCKKLTRLAVSGLLTDNAFKLIGEYGKSVRTLSVAFAGDSDSALKHVLGGCGKLEKLEIRDCPFGDSALRSGLHHYYSMRFLWMSSCKLTRHGCQDIARSLPRLVTELIDADAGEDDGISEFAGTLYMYRSLEGRRHDAPDSVTIL